ncbi:heterokaryon incompatibility protein-domain-containing protein [Podospora aff. communis PSN243]|uniref:Heterokaryon incompatibility protein-domain-containing protein n=1 Tax=Podospora aff. communis PSN243 TaxID=3040156 RepID=A0AAV9GQA9_9PEZI|nr:heterokaryon incompatibility protein-domain-containing protein [Podospora aff. communis PSN243]
MNSNASKYIYSPLPPAPARTIRLIRVLPSSDPLASIAVEIESHGLSSAPSYDAISYVWGDPSESLRPITCDGFTIQVTPNLHWALRRVRCLDGDPVIIWADAICINQDDVDERSAQVAFMGEIYSNARRVLVCMGDAPTEGAEKQVARLIEVVALFRERRLGLDQVAGECGGQLERLCSWLQNAQRPWKALAEVMVRPWFSRVWVIQEVGLAKKPVVLYGAEEFGYRDLVVTAAWATSQTSLLQHSIRTWRIHTDWMDWSRPETAQGTFYDLLDHASLLACRDPRDRIYALLGHPLARTKHGGHPIITPDYTKDLNELYVQLTEALFQTVGLRALVSIEHTQESLADGSPSWAIRWHIQEKFNDISDPLVAVFGAGRLVDPDRPPQVNGPFLTVQGLTADKIAHCFAFSFSAAAPGGLEFCDIQNPGQSFGVGQLLGFLISTSSKNRMDVQWAVIETLCAGRMEDRRQENRDFFSLSALFDRIDFWHTLRLYASGRIFAVTEKGRFALIPRISRPGDEICVIHGLDVPFVTRSGGHNGCRLLLGEGFVHGIMRGEALRVANEEAEHELVFC